MPVLATVPVWRILEAPHWKNLGRGKYWIQSNQRTISLETLVGKVKSMECG